jgi:hypothetical protein
MPTEVITWDGKLDAATKAKLQGFLLHWRTTFLAALESTQIAEADRIPMWKDSQYWYYRHAESVTRLLLFDLGIRLDRDRMPEGFLDVTNT